MARRRPLCARADFDRPRKLARKSSRYRWRRRRLRLQAVSHGDRKSTRLNSSHLVISYAVFCLKKKKKIHHLSQYYLSSHPPKTPSSLHATTHFSRPFATIPHNLHVLQQLQHHQDHTQPRSITL